MNKPKQMSIFISEMEKGTTLRMFAFLYSVSRSVGREEHALSRLHVVFAEIRFAEKWAFTYEETWLDSGRVTGKGSQKRDGFLVLIASIV